ncbi:MAG: DNA polymerase III subunit alpha [Ignavibacteria bacterium]|jgi:DNA polymerase-3 subunit alpha|nr:DNA polymerase III subunit alpha [Ignavibacteria bacterium]
MFVHLHNHTHYSILDAIVTVKELVAAAKADNQPAVALTDHGVMFGAIEFYEECKKQEIKPIIGCEVYIANGSRHDRTALQSKSKKKNYFHLLLLAKNDIGYHNLLKMSSFGHTEGFYSRPRIDKELLEKYCEGLVCTSACMGGIVPMLISDNNYEKAKEEALFYKKLFGEDFYIEIQKHHYPDENLLNTQLVQLAKEIDVKIVATNDIHYLKKEHALAHNVYLLIKESKGGADKPDIHKLRYKTDEFYFRTEAEMTELFKEYPEAISNTIEIMEKCNLEIELDKHYMPDFPLPANTTATTLDEYLSELVDEGLKQRYHVVTGNIEQRAKYELGVIQQMQFPGYFLIVWDFIRAAKELGVSVGPGRGSAAGSIVAYALGITNVDPLQYDLLFERFLNPERVSMPDIDIDFSDETRDKIINYVQNKYGEDSVAQIITFGTLSSKAVINDVGRVLGIPLNDVRRITREVGFGERLADVKKKASIQWVFDEEDERYQRLFELCEILENKNRNTGTHAAGVVIAPSDICNYVPLYRSDKQSKSQSLEIVTQYEMSYLEKAGLVKMDFLGLRTLSIIDRALMMIKENFDIDIDLDTIDFKDQQVYKMLSDGQTKAVFQFEGSGMTEYLKQLKPQNLEELTAMNALYRPGPMENIPSFINRKYGKEAIQYLHPLMEKSLSNTYGVIVYQEQVMQIVQDLAGFTLGEADVMRRAMGKKKREYMIEFIPKFMEGCAKNGISEKIADEVFELLLKFASYGFNKSHSLAYSYLAYQTAWLKTHYTAEYLASFMTAVMNGQNELVDVFEEAKKFNINILPPDVNLSNTYFVAKDDAIVFGMAGIKGVGTAVVDDMVAVRKEKPFSSIFDFAGRVSQCNKRVLEALICAGAFDSIYSTKERATLFNSVDLALEYAKNENNRNNTGTADLFGDTEDAVTVEPKLIFAPDWDETERLSKEREVLSFAFSGQLLNKYYTAIKSFNSADITNKQMDSEDDIAENTASDNSDTLSTYGLITGMVEEVRTREDKKGKRIAFPKVRNYEGVAELIFWSDAYEKYSDLLNVDSVICVKGRIEKESGEIAKVTVDEAYDINSAIKKYAAAINIAIDISNFDNAKLQQLKEYISDQNDSKAASNIVFHVHNPLNSYRRNYHFKAANTAYSNGLLTELGVLFGKDNLSVTITNPTAPVNNRRSFRK